MINLTDEDGLPSNTVYKVVEDKKGYLWIATANGLCRYDGTNFKKINLKGTSSNDILDVQIDKENHVWILSSAYETFKIDNNKVIKINFKKYSKSNTFFNFKIIGDSIYYLVNNTPSGNIAVLRTNLMNSLSPLVEFVQADPEIYKLSGYLNVNVNFEHQIYFQNIKKNKFRLYKSDQECSSKTLIDQDLGIIDDKILDEKQFSYINKILYYKKSPIGTIYEGTYFSTTKSEILTYQFEDEVFICTRSCTFKFNLKDQKILKIVDNDFILSVFKDSNNKYFLCSQNSGIYVINSLPLFLLNSGYFNFTTPISSIKKMDNRLLIGGTDGRLFSVFYNQFKRIQIPFIGKSKKIVLTNKNSFLLSGDAGLIYCEPSSKNTFSCNRITDYSIKNVLNIDSERFLVSAGSSWIINKNEIKNLTHVDLSNRPFYGNFGKIFCAGIDNKGFIIVGKNNGLYTWKNDSLYSYDDTLINHSITHIEYNNPNIITIAANQIGVIRYENHKINRFISDSIFNFNQITAIKVQNDSIAYIGCNSGLYIHGIQNDKIRRIDLCDGIPSEQILCLDADSNYIYCGTSKGYFIYPIRDVMNDHTNASIDIESVKLFTKDGYQAFSQNIPYYNNNIEIQTNVISLLSKGRTKIKYRIKGKEDSWIVSDDKTIRLVSLSSGNYSLEIIGIDENGEDTKNVALVNFTILPPWWKTKWFYFLSLLGLAALGSGTVYWRIQSQYKNKLKEKEIVAQLNGLRMQALQNQMNPHFIFNAMNAIQGFLVNAELQKARDYLIAFARLIRHIFDFSKLKEVSLSEELSFLETYIALEKLRIGDKVSHEINLSDKVKNQINDILIPPLIIQPMVENAFKHGLFHKKGQGHLVLSFDFVENILIVSIKDDGIGRKKAQELANHNPGSHLSSSLKATIERLELYNEGKVKHSVEIRDLNDEQNGISGTIVILNFTIKFDELHKISG